MKHSSVRLNTPVEFVNVSSINPLISKCEIKVCYVGEEPNRNGSIITKEVATQMGGPLPGSPIVGYYNEKKEDFEEHNVDIELKDGEWQFKELTKPFGFVPTDAKVWFQKFMDDGINEREYLMTEGYLWTGQYPECQRVVEEGNNQSMELDEKTLKASWAKTDNHNCSIFIINEAIISKLCILGEDNEPCFEGASIQKIQFSLDFSTEYSAMVKELEDLLKGGSQEMDNIEEVVQEEVIEEEPVVVETEFAKDEEKEDEKEEELCPECGKPVAERTCKDEKKKYNLDEIPEYVDLSREYSLLSSTVETLNTEIENLKNENAELVAFKAKVERDQKQSMIDKFSMLSDEDKLDVVENIDKYSLSEIEAKLCVICVHNKVSFGLDDDNTSNNSVHTYSLSHEEDESVPAWIKAVKRVNEELH